MQTTGYKQIIPTKDEVRALIIRSSGYSCPWECFLFF